MIIDAELTLTIDSGSDNPITITSFQSGTKVLELIENVKTGVLDSLDFLGMMPDNKRAHNVLYQEVEPIRRRRRRAASVVDIGNVIVGEYFDDDIEET